MADSVFARYQLEKHGWTEGVGLGKHENGITDPIKVYRKNNKDGVGHIPGSDLTKNWWDQAYKKAASQILVKITEDGATIHKKETKEIEKNKTLLYARFVKGATLKSSEGITVEEAEEASSESDNEKEQIPSRLTDEEIFKICGGRTAHKAAKHGLKQNGKLQRIQEQERQFLESLNKKSKSVENLSISGTKRRHRDGKVVEESVISKAEEQAEVKLSREDKLHVKNEQNKVKDEIGSLSGERAEGAELSVLTKRTKKKKCKEENELNLKKEDMNGVIENGKVKSNKKKKDLTQEDEARSGDMESVVYNEKKKKKKKRKRQYLEEEKELEKESQEIYEHDERTEDVRSVRKKRKKNKLEAGYRSEKKKRKCWEVVDEAEMQQTEIEENSKTDPTLDELQKEVKKEKKRKKRNKKKQDEGTEENGLIEDERSSVEKTRPAKILRNEIKKRISDEDMTEICHKKKVVFSPKLFTVHTFSQDENEMTSSPKKKKKKKKKTRLD